MKHSRTGAALAGGRPHIARLLTSGALAALLPCITVNAATPVTSLLEMRRTHVVVQQWDISCGAAALATVLTYQHGDTVEEKEIARSMLRLTDPLRVKVRGGFSLLDMKRYVEQRGYAASGYSELTIPDLVGFAPVLVPVNFRGYSHFVVFKGIIGDKVLLADPGFGNRSVELDTFRNAWVQPVGFVVRRKDNIPPPNRLVP